MAARKGNRNEHVVNANGDTGACRVRKPDVFDAVQHHDRIPRAGMAITRVDELRHLLLGHKLVHFLEGNAGGQDFPKYHPADRRVALPSLRIANGLLRHPRLSDRREPTDLDPGVLGNLSRVVGHADFFGIRVDP